MIVAKGLTKHYGSKLAVDRLSFDVRPGVVTGFLGPNGSGKSTTMRMIMGLDAPNDGDVTVNGRHYHDLPWPLHEVGALLEAKAIHPGRRAAAHLRMLAEANRIAPRRVDEVLEIVGLSSVAGQRAGKFSLGMSQRLGIAAALLGDPEVLLFDEPVNGLDPDGIRWVRNLLKGLAREGRTVFVSSHLMSEMAVTADEVVIIGKGRLISQIPIDELLAQSSQRFVRVRSPEIARLKEALEGGGAATVLEDDGSLSVRGKDEVAIGELAASIPVVLHLLAPQSASLEEAFMELTEDSVEYHGSSGAGSGISKGASVVSTSTSSPRIGAKELPPGRYGMAGLLRSEWTKLRTVRSTVWTLAVTVVLGIGISALATAETRAHWTPSNAVGFDPISTSLIGVFVGQFTIGVLGVLAMSAEYGTGTIRATFSVAPRRPLVLAAKAVVFGTVALIVSEVVAFLSFLLGQALLSAPAIHATLSSPGALRSGRRKRPVPVPARARGARARDAHPAYGRRDQRLRRHPPRAADHRSSPPVLDLH